MARATHGGGVVFRRGESGPLYLLVEARGSRGRWVLPKGGVGRKESAEEAALREVAEEGAVEVRAIHGLGRARLEKAGDLVEVEFFLMEHVRDTRPFESRVVRWCRFEKALAALDDAEALLMLCRANELVMAALPASRRSGAALRAASDVVVMTSLGVPAVLMAALPFVPELAQQVGSGAAAVAGVAAALAASYAAGNWIPRFALAVLAKAEGHLRVRASLEKQAGLEDEAVQTADLVRAKLGGGGRLRTQICAAAVLTVCLPGVTAAAVQLGVRLRGDEWLPALIPLAYSLAFAGAIAPGLPRAPDPSDEAAVRSYAKRRRLHHGNASSATRAWCLAVDLAATPACWAGLALLAFSLARAPGLAGSSAWEGFGWTAIAVVGSLFSGLSASSWWQAVRRQEQLRSLVDGSA
jgi:8-oxo-dGTP pyrophosphatase MutT (NUDIX family)